MCLIISMNFLFVMICLVCHDRQSGFRSKHSCETAFHLLVDEWLSSIYNKEIVGVLFIDFCKAFDI